MTMRFVRQCRSAALAVRGRARAFSAVPVKCGAAWVEMVAAEARCFRTVWPVRVVWWGLRAKSSASWRTSREKSCASVACWSSAV
jgi:hypothetical protein